MDIPNFSTVDQRFAIINEYGMVFLETLATTPEAAKKTLDDERTACNAKLRTLFPNAQINTLTAEEFIKSGACALVRIQWEKIEGAEYFDRMLAQSASPAQPAPPKA